MPEPTDLHSDATGAGGLRAGAPRPTAPPIEGEGGSPFGELDADQEHLELAPESFPAFDTPPDPPPAPDPASPAHRRWLAVGGVLLLLIGLGLAFFLLRPSQDADAGTNLLLRFTESAETFRPELATVSEEEATLFLVERFGWPIETPALPAMQLVGVGGATLSETVEVPGYRFDHENGETAVVFAYDYVFLDQIADQFGLPEAVYASLGEARPVDTRRLGDAYIVSWRSRAVIYSAVTRDEDTYEAIGQGVQ